MTDTTGASPAAEPTGGSPTHVSQTQQTDYQQQAPGAAGNAQAAAAPSSATNPAASTKTENNTTSSQISTQPGGETKPAVETKPADDGQTPAKQQPEGEFKLPDEYKDKPWAAKVKSLDDVYKQIDTLDALKGKKTVIPNLKEATPEEREAFYSQLRGKDASEYQIPKNDAFVTPDDYQPVIAKLFMDNGVSPVQAEAIIKGYQELGAKNIAKQYDPDGFKASMQTAFGNDWDKVTGQVRNTIKGMMNPDDQKALDTIPNSLLGVVYRTLGNTIKAFGIKETDGAHFAPGGKPAPTDIASIRQGYRDQLSALSMRPHTSAEVAEITQKLADTYTNDPRLQATG